MSNPDYTPADDRGRGSAFIVYCLYLLSIPSAAIFALVGVIWAMAARGDAGPLARTHLDDQIRIWWIAFYWAIALAILWLIGLLLAFVLVGFVVWWILGGVAFLVMVWFTIKSALGLIALMNGRPR